MKMFEGCFTKRDSIFKWVFHDIKTTPQTVILCEDVNIYAFIKYQIIVRDSLIVRVTPIKILKIARGQPIHPRFATYEYDEIFQKLIPAIPVREWINHLLKFDFTTLLSRYIMNPVVLRTFQAEPRMGPHITDLLIMEASVIYRLSSHLMATDQISLTFDEVYNHLQTKSEDIKAIYKSLIEKKILHVDVRKKMITFQWIMDSLSQFKESDHEWIHKDGVALISVHDIKNVKVVYQDTTLSTYRLFQQQKLPCLLCVKEWKNAPAPYIPKMVSDISPYLSKMTGIVGLQKGPEPLLHIKKKEAKFQKIHQKAILNSCKLDTFCSMSELPYKSLKDYETVVIGCRNNMLATYIPRYLQLEHVIFYLN
jgi:hypothetical protein